MIWFSFLVVLFGAIIYGIEKHRPLPVPFIDAIFLATSAVSATGLYTNDFSQTSIATQIIIWALIVVGGSVFDTTVLLGIQRILWHKPAMIANLDEETHRPATATAVAATETTVDGAQHSP
jgi:Trk-type K+ transport system membrane component